jgi:hypothetical protein
MQNKLTMKYELSLIGKFWKLTTALSLFLVSSKFLFCFFAIHLAIQKASSGRLGINAPTPRKAIVSVYLFSIKRYIAMSINIITSVLEIHLPSYVVARFTHTKKHSHETPSNIYPLMFLVLLFKMEPTLPICINHS